MQDAGSITSIAGLEDPKLSQTIADDTDWLENITLDESDYELSSSQFDPKFNNHAELPDEDASLIAHLRNRDQASDLDEYEWRSDDLVSEVYSDDDDNTSDEELPRLARKDIFEQGIQREFTWSREYREQRDEPHIFYIQKIQERLGFIDDEGEDYEGQSYGSEDDWSAQACGEDWGTPETSSGGEWTRVSEVPWTAEDGWTEWKGEDREPWMRPEIEQTVSENSIGGEGLEKANGNTGELCLRTRPPGWEPFLKKNAFNGLSSTLTTLTEPSLTNSTHVSPNPTFRDATHVTNLNETSSLPAPTARIDFKHPKRTSRFKDPKPIKLDPTHDTNPSLNEHILTTFLDTCIRKTKALLADGTKALTSIPKLEQISDLDEKILKEKKKEKARYPPSSRDMAGDFVREREAQTQKLLKVIDTAPAEIVRVDGWYKVKGSETWREVGTGVEDECVMLCEGGVLR